MKTSELIALLEQNMIEVGDLDVTITIDGETCIPCAGLLHETDDSEKGMSVVLCDEETLAALS